MDEVMRDDITTRFLGFSDVHTPAAGHLLSITFQHSMHAGVFLTSIQSSSKNRAIVVYMHSPMAFLQLLWQDR